MSSSKVEIEFEQFEVEKNLNEGCHEYLQIGSHDKFCEKPANPITVNVDTSANQISFTFRADGFEAKKGFWLLYRGNLMLKL